MNGNKVSTTEGVGRKDIDLTSHTLDRQAQHSVESVSCILRLVSDSFQNRIGLGENYGGVALGHCGVDLDVLPVQVDEFLEEYKRRQLLFWIRRMIRHLVVHLG